MLDLLGIVIGLMFVIVFVSKDIKEGWKGPAQRGREHQQHQQHQQPRSKVAQILKWKKPRIFNKDVTDNDLKVMATILSAGLVDVDPSSVQQLKEFRDLRGAST